MSGLPPIGRLAEEAELGVELAALAATNSYLEKVLNWAKLKPMSAGLGLMALSELSSGQADRRTNYSSVIGDLQITPWFT